MAGYLEERFELSDPAFASVLDELPLWSAPFGLKLLDTIKYRPKMNVLDIGCGTGFPLIELADRLGNSCQLYGIDPGLAAQKRAQLKARTHALSNVVLINGLAEQLPFPDNFFHLIVSNNGINNVKNPEAVLSECYRTSRPKAQLIITVNLPGTMKEFYGVFEETLREHGKYHEIEAMRAHILEKRKPHHQMMAMITGAGFYIKKIVEDVFYMRFLDGSAMFNHFFIKLAFLDSWKKILSPQDRKPIFEILERKLNKIASINGALNFTIPFVCIDCRKA